MEHEKRTRDFRKYPVYQMAVHYATKVYKITASMPWFEKKGLCDQLQRAVVSISSNIAEGSSRPSDPDFCHFLDVALGSAYEVETQLTISHNIKYIDDSTYNDLIKDDIEIQKQLSLFIRSIRSNLKSH